MVVPDISPFLRGIIPLLSIAILSVAGSCSLDPLGLGSSQYGCPAPAGGLCRSVSEIHASDFEAVESVSARPPLFRDGTVRGKAAPELDVGRTPPRVLRAWLAPYVDADGDYIGEQRIRIVVDVGEWTSRPAGREPDSGETDGE